MPILVATAIIGVVCLLQYLTEHTGYLEFFKRLQWMSYDVRVRLASQYPQPNATNIGGVFIDDIVITDINDGTLGASLMEEIGDKSLTKRHTWPWPRFIFGRLVRELNAQGAKAVGFDIFFDQLDPNEEDLKYDIPGVGLIGSDEFFATQLKAAGNVVLGTEGENLFPADYYRTNAWKNGNVKSESDYGVLRRVRPYFDHTNLVWHSMIQYQARALGFNLNRSRIEGGKIFFDQQNGNEYEVPLNADGSLNMEEITGDKTETPEAPYTVKVERIWHMGIILGSQIVGLDLEKAQIEPGRILLPGKDGVQRIIPLDQQGYLYIDWSLRWDDIKAQNQDSVKKLLVQDAARHNGVTDDWEPVFKDKIVIVGSVGTGNNIADLGATPLESKAMLVTKHLNVANSVILGRFIQRHSYMQELFLILAMGAASAILTWRLRVLSASIGVITIAAIYFTTATYLYVAYRYWLPFVFPVVGSLMFTHVGMVTYRVVFEQREQRRVKSVFNKLVSPNVVNELLHAEQLNLGGARRKITVFFADVRGFTEMTDVNQAKAEEFVQQNNLTGEAAEAHHDQQARETLETVNRYLATIADMVKKHNGTLDKYIGDCVMAFWGAPTPNEQHALYCVRAAVDAQRAMYALNQERFAENKRREQENETRTAAGQPLLHMLPLLALGTGINTGMVTVGLMGSDAHILNYTVFGRDVNLASRLEGVSGRGRIIIGEATYEEIKRDDPTLAATCVALEAVTVKGIRNAVKIYEVPWKQGLAEMPKPTASHSMPETPASTSVPK